MVAAVTDPRGRTGDSEHSGTKGQYNGTASPGGSAPGPIYLRGVTRYKSTHNAKFLKDAYEELVSRYPESE
jgi:hypothetical protein